jgi:hypothetical protein
VGLPTDSPFLLYLGSSKNIAWDESGVVEAIAMELQNHSDPNLRNTHILLRPHPAHADIFYRFADHPRIHMWPRKGVLPDDPDTRADFLDSVHYAIGTLGINTSGMLDTIILGKPTASILLPEYQRTQEQAVHFQHLQESNALSLLSSVQELPDLLLRWMKGEDNKAAQREHFVRTFVFPHGNRQTAGSVAADYIEAIGQGISPHTIPIGTSAPTSQPLRMS